MAGLWALALAPFLLLLVLNWGPGPPGDATDAYHYMLHGRALAEGSGYSNTGYIYTELNPWIGPRVQPPGMAIFLYPAFKFLGGNVLLMRLMVVACAIGFLILSGRTFAQSEGLHMGLSVTLLVGLIPALAAFASSTFSDFVSAASLWTVIYVVDSDRRFDATKLILITVFGSMAMMTRLTGVALMAALFLFAVARYRDFGWRPLVPLGIWTAGGLAAFSLVGAVIPTWAFEGFPRLGYWFTVIFGYRFGFFEVMLYPFPRDLANDIYHVVGFGVILLGLAAWLHKGWSRFVTFFVVSYLAMIAALPIAGEGRYLWPIAPFVLFGLLNGVKTLVKLLVPYLAPVRVDRVVLATAIVLALASTARLAWTPRRQAMIEVPGMQEIVDYVRTIDPESGARLAFEFPRLLTWETRVPAMGLPRRSRDKNIDRVIEELRFRRITHVISFDREPPSPGEEIIRQVLQERPLMFTLVHRRPRFAVYQFE